MIKWWVTSTSTKDVFFFSLMHYKNLELANYVFMNNDYVKCTLVWSVSLCLLK